MGRPVLPVEEVSLTSFHDTVFSLRSLIHGGSLNNFVHPLDIRYYYTFLQRIKFLSILTFLLTSLPGILVQPHHNLFISSYLIYAEGIAYYEEAPPNVSVFSDPVPLS